MAKKKKTTSENKNNNGYSVELTGLILILVGLIGFGFGPVGALLKKFAMFLLGEWWPVILIFVLVIGFYMLIKRKLPNFFSARYIGLYLVIIVILVLSHLTFVTSVESPSKIFEATLNNYMSRVASIGANNALQSSGQASIVIGGGIIGASFSFAIASLFGVNGTYIVLSFVGLFGIVLLFNVNLSNLLNDIINKFKGLKKKVKEDNAEENMASEVDKRGSELEKRLREGVEEAPQKQVVLNSMEELRQYEKPKQEEPPKEIHIPVVASPIVTENSNYKLPPMSILDDPLKPKKTNSNQFLLNNKQNLERVLRDFQIEGKVVDIHMGPTVTQFELVVPSGTKVSRISSINKEIALALAAKDVRIEAPIPGKSTIGIEIPNQAVAAVKIKEILNSKEMVNKTGGLQVALGKDIMGVPRFTDLTKMPHLLIAGSTGSGKSVCSNSIIASLLMRYRPDEVKLVLVDPKQVELSNYNGVPHLLCPVVTDPKKASLVLQKVVTEMDKRYHIFADKGAKKIDDYNKMIDEENRRHPDTPIKRMPYIVVLVDEMADLMIAARKEVEDSIMRITQLARAAGIHLIVATQRPSTDVITGVVKTNIPSRIAFSVASAIDSRTILDASGAEKLLGKGDMLFLPMGENVPIRIQGCFISDDEIRRVIEYVCKEQQASYDETLMHASTEEPAETSTTSGMDADHDEPMYNEIVEFAVQTGKISASLIQRRFRFGYNRAARVIDLLEERGIIGPQNGSKPREVLVKLNEENKG
mgnify:FL=1